jgi:hypothetical protein
LDGGTSQISDPGAFGGDGAISNVTVVLDAIQAGDPEAPAQLLALVSVEPDRLATHWLDREAPGQTLQPTALVHEVYLRLNGPAQGLPDTRVGTFTQALYDEAKQRGWVVISMKRDWRRLFPFDPEVVPAP